MENPFIVPGAGVVELGPLCPWQREDHVHRYAAIDNAEPAFGLFTQQTRHPHLLDSTSQVVVVVGNKGCGKSSLIHRCAHWLRGDYPGREGSKAPEIVDLSGATVNQADDQDKQWRAICGRLVRDLQRRGILDKDRMTELLADVSSPNDLLYELGADLAFDGKSAIVILPAFELIAHAESWVSFCAGSQRLLFFCEITPSEETGDLSRRLAGKALILEVGQLNENDGNIFIDNRMSASADVQKTISGAAVKQIISDRTRSGGLSIGELSRVCLDAYRAAIDSGTDQIGYVELSRYYVLNHRGDG